MSKGLNKATLVGNLGADPEIRYMSNGAAVCNLRLATEEQWKDKQTGQKQKHTEWHRVVFFNKLAEIAGEYLSKGSQILVEGTIRYRKWTDQGGVERTSTEIHGRDLLMLDSRGNATVAVPPQAKAPETHNHQGRYQSQADEFDDDIPF